MIPLLLLLASWLEGELFHRNAKETDSCTQPLPFPCNCVFADKFLWKRLQQATVHFSRKKLKMIKSTSQAQCGWGASPTMLIGTTGLLPLLGEDLAAPWRTPSAPGQCWCRNAEFDFCMKTYGWNLKGEKMIMKEIPPWHIYTPKQSTFTHLQD